MARDHIVLVGSMGSGKTTIGAKLAEALGRPFVDSDEQIEVTYGATGRELAERRGVAWLHAAEASAFSKALESADPAVIAAAASIADRPELVAMLQPRDAVVVLLEAELEVLAGRTEAGDHRRPVDWDAMSHRLEQRRTRLAAVADVAISTSSVDPMSVVAEVLGVLATGRGVLRSIYRRESGGEPGRFDVHIELIEGRFEPGDRLGMCSGAALRPTGSSAAVKDEALSTRLVLSPDPSELIDGSDHWTIPNLRPLRQAIHANDGPVSAWIERTTGTTIELDVVPAELDAPQPEPAGMPASSGPIGDPTLNLLPRPVAITSDGQPRLGVGVRIVNDQADRWPAVEALAGRLGIDLAAGRALLELDATIDIDLDDGGYWLEINGSEARLRGGSPAAVTHGMITLAQLVAAGVPGRVHVADAPRHGHRGLSVDLARRWFEPHVVERLIDLAAWRKLSHLQLHLTDDEAWRVPVDAYPVLAEVGGVRGSGLAIGPLCGSGAAPYGRAYTPAEIGRWVERAEGLAVELVPEIDIPAHCHAALVAVPELGDPDDRGRVLSVQGFANNVLGPGPVTTRFLNEVFGSLADLFPNSSVLHLGGDEVPPGAWTRSPRAAEYGRDYGMQPGPAMAAALIAEAAGAIDAAGRGWAGWQEVAQFDLAIEPTYVVAWTSSPAIGDVLNRGHRVVASPSDAYYLDMAVDDHWATPGASWAGSTPMTATCDLDLSNLDKTEGRLIGGQAALWAEHVDSLEVLDELLFPRLDGVAEATWTGHASGRADDISRRSRHHPTVLRQAAPLTTRTADR